MQWHLPIIEVFAAFIGNILCVDTATPQNERQQCVNRASTEHQQSINTASMECQQSVNDFGCCIVYNPRPLLRHIPGINGLAAIMSKWDRNMVTAPVWKWASTERQQFSVLHLVWSKGRATTFTHNLSIGSLYRHYRVSILQLLKMSVNRASTGHQQSVNRASTQRQQCINRVSTILGVASCIFQGLCYSIYPESMYWQPLWANEIATWSQLQSESECQQSVNDLVCCMIYNARAALLHLPILGVLGAIIGNIVCIDTATPQNEHQQSVNRVSTEHQQIVNRASTERQQSVNRASTERQQSVNRASTEHQHSVNTVSTECQWLSVLHLV